MSYFICLFRIYIKPLKVGMELNSLQTQAISLHLITHIVHIRMQAPKP